MSAWGGNRTLVIRTATSQLSRVTLPTVHDDRSFDVGAAISYEKAEVLAGDLVQDRIERVDDLFRSIVSDSFERRWPMVFERDLRDRQESAIIHMSDNGWHALRAEPFKLLEKPLLLLGHI